MYQYQEQLWNVLIKFVHSSNFCTVIAWIGHLNYNQVVIVGIKGYFRHIVPLKKGKGSIHTF